MSNHDIFNFIRVFFHNDNNSPSEKSKTLATLLNHFTYKTRRQSNTFLFYMS